MVTIGTAGHIDHGKTSLVKALTAIDPDRLPEEKQRGMTIDLGFAWLRLESGEMVGIVDVPGHKQFVHNVIPGLTGVDAVLLVVAADDGWMPQTQEHLEIIDLLGISSGVVALNKVDLAPDPDWLVLVEADIRTRLENTSLRDAPIIHTSARTGEGFDKLKEAIGLLVSQIKARQDIGKPRLPVDRVFTLKGSGVIVTGTLSGGRLAMGDEVVISPGGIPCRIRGLESYKEHLEVAMPGSRVAINLAGVPREAVCRGDVIMAAGHTPLPSSLLDVKISLLGVAKKPVKGNDEVSLFLGTRELLARIVVIGQRQVSPGQEAFTQLRLSASVSSFIGEHFIVRAQSPALTLGGGLVLDPCPVRYRLKDAAATIARLHSRGSLRLDDLIISELASCGYGLRQGFLEASTYSEKEIAAAVDRLAQAGALVVASGYIAISSYFDHKHQLLLDELVREHAAFPLKQGTPQAELQTHLGLPKELFARLLADLVASGQMRREGETVALESHRVGLSPEQEKLASRIEETLAKSSATPPAKEELLAEIPGAGELVYYLLKEGRLVELPGGILLTGQRYRELKQQITAFLVEKSAISIQDVAALTGFSRKYSIPLLGRLDADGITRRQENVRVLAAKPGQG